jgi:hypothetical protein
MLKILPSLPNAFVIKTFRHPSSVTRNGSEEPFLVPASPRGKLYAPQGGARWSTAAAIHKIR